MAGPVTSQVSSLAVLLVDDSPTNLRLTGAMLKSVGCEVVTAESGEEAVELVQARTHDFSLVLLDYQMPGIDGPETARRLFELLDDVPPILALTGDVTLEVFKACRDAGMRLVLRKPVERSHIVAIVERLRALQNHASRES
ncbi:MAG: response regulator [Myxococcota bacterium]